MPYRLPSECLNEIFEQLEDKVTLHSCLLVDRLWCEVSVRILWKSIWNYNTLIACLPNESKEFLLENKIFISTPNSNPPSFNYVTFIKNLSINVIVKNIKYILDFNYNECIIVTQEVFKMLMNQISLKKLNFYFDRKCIYYISNVPFITYPGAIYCLRNLSELNCDSNIPSEFLNQLSRTCHNIRSLDVVVLDVLSDGLTDLISVQKNLKDLSITKC